MNGSSAADHVRVYIRRLKLAKNQWLKWSCAWSDLPGGWGFNPRNDFFDPPSLRRFELLGGRF